MFQRLTIIGRVGQEPQMRYTPDGALDLSPWYGRRVAGSPTRPCVSGGVRTGRRGAAWALCVLRPFPSP